jgi:hypothetical protein
MLLIVQNVNPDGSLTNDNACIDNTAESNHNTMKVHIFLDVRYTRV